MPPRQPLALRSYQLLSWSLVTVIVFASGRELRVVRLLSVVRGMCPPLAAQPLERTAARVSQRRTLASEARMPAPPLGVMTSEERVNFDELATMPDGAQGVCRGFNTLVLLFQPARGTEGVHRSARPAPAEPIVVSRTFSAYV
eukprot:TRINITY_DN5209_c0_g1_i3.p1 TRINITY_DN5209_c0_g1~~TRINITY_DN5209_c0_g1_i3.p1  ORF type:complete len:143 (-),score=0.99 TRINITY_DN5209_c0_g1_i3:43-471(-)